MWVPWPPRPLASPPSSLFPPQSWARLSAALAYFDSYRSARLPANLLQAQRDYFGAHTSERTDKPAGEWFHTEWFQPEA